MIDWWNNLTLVLQIFYGIGLAAFGLSAVQLILSLIGIGGDALDVDLDASGTDSPSGVGLFSTQTLSAFFLGFGWFGAAMISAGVGLILAVIAAVIIGVVVMLGAYFLIRQLMRLQSSGNLDYRNAIGEEATVYVTLPGNDEDGGGQIQVMIQSRLRTVAARKATPGAIKPGDKVRITGMFAQTTFNVEPLHNS